jgi:hypothetical protein
VTGESVDKAHYERSDISVVPAAGVVAEAMVMLTLASFVLEKFGGDTIDDVRAGLDRYLARIAAAPEAPIAGGRRPSGGTAAGPVAQGTAAAAAATPAATPRHGLTGTDEAGSGGDD